MSLFPRLVFDCMQYRNNVKKVAAYCAPFDIGIFVVTKVFRAFRPLVEAIQDLDIDGIADSRLENLEHVSDIPIQKLLLRLPMPSEAERVVNVADISLNSEWETLVTLNEAAGRLSKRHAVILMMEMGDLREGMDNAQFEWILNRIHHLKNIDFIGIGANFSCYGGIMATPEKLNALAANTARFTQVTGVQNPIVSGGNSSSLYLVENGEMPSGINNLRLGEALILGRETAFGNHIFDLSDSLVSLDVELIEIKVKPSYPIGVMTYDAFGEKPQIEDRGMITRGILAIGQQDVDLKGLIPYDENIEILGGSSDHLIVEIKAGDYRVGDIVRFRVNYSALLRLSTSPYVQKRFENIVPSIQL
ncbi:MAG: ornithine racemase [Clostridiales bacterium]|nr:ornithine racemase [Clostridiales bacterium]MDN5297817.1 ornithine racemase [Clostridiales bacterium]